MNSHALTYPQLILQALAVGLTALLDAAEAFVPRGNFRPEADYGSGFIGLAHALGLHDLGADFREAVDRCLQTRLPEGVLSPHRSSHEVRNRLMMANPIERLGSHLRRRGVTGGGATG